MTVMITETDLDTRLRQHHQQLASTFGRRTPIPVPALAPIRRSRHRLMLAGVVALALAVTVPVLTFRLLPAVGEGPATVHVSGFTVSVAADTVATAPRMTRDQAVAAVQAYLVKVGEPILPNGHTITGLTVTGASFVANVQSVAQPCTHVRIPQPENLWVIGVSAPAQAGWQAMRGGFLVNDATGSLAGGDLLVGQSGVLEC
jgi:hypothetical protein